MLDLFRLTIHDKIVKQKLKKHLVQIWYTLPSIVNLNYNIEKSDNHENPGNR